MHSLPIILLTATFTGMVLAIQTAYGLSRFGAKNYVGNIVSLAIVRELGPVLTAVMLCGRVGAGIAAEIASMVVTEQVDAIRALGASPIRKLVTPRILAAIIVGALAIYLPRDQLVRLIVFRDFFDVSIPILGFGALIKYLCSCTGSCKCGCSKCSCKTNS